MKLPIRSQLFSSVLAVTLSLGLAQSNSPITFLVDGGSSAQVTCPVGDFCYVKKHQDTSSTAEATLSPSSNLKQVTTKVQDGVLLFRFVSDTSPTATVNATFPEDTEGILYCNTDCTCTNGDGSPCAAARTASDVPSTGPMWNWDEREPDTPNTCPFREAAVGNIERCPEVMRALPLEMTCECGYIFNIGSGLLYDCQTSDDRTLPLDVSRFFGLCFDEERFFDPTSTSPPIPSPTFSPGASTDPPTFFGTPAPTFSPTSESPKQYVSALTSVGAALFSLTLL